METKNSGKENLRFIILIPHRDALNHLSVYREKLFAAGFSGAHSFPPAAPLARVSEPFGREELKELARNIRNLTGENDGKLQTTGTDMKAAILKSGNFEQPHLPIFGLSLNIPGEEGIFPPVVRDKILKSFLPPVLCAAVMEPEENPAGGNLIKGEAPFLSFRAASIANLVIRPLAAGGANYSFEWKISPPVWLPAFRKA